MADAPAHQAAVLADRIAAALVHREPGWRLPRRSALARRYNVGLGEIDTAIVDLTRRSLVRRLPDGQLYRASAADYWVPLEGVAGLGARLDPMGSLVECNARHAAVREAPQDIAWALGVPSGEPVLVVRCVWTVAGDPAAISTGYLPAGPVGGEPDSTGTAPTPTSPKCSPCCPAPRPGPPRSASRCHRRSRRRRAACGCHRAAR